ncbi:hypothetical protein MTY59_14820 [Mycobacterium senriense]|uniref:Uncharacterized protein n=1 Tax=Mycobacterium senriense TaxID=2775496 RepID=A0ABN6IGA6_9MYCO|nr:hypothetical protein MTY59_14820 [Mycobacterium senriense]
MCGELPAVRLLFHYWRRQWRHDTGQAAAGVSGPKEDGWWETPLRAMVKGRQARRPLEVGRHRISRNQYLVHADG